MHNKWYPGDKKRTSGNHKRASVNYKRAPVKQAIEHFDPALFPLTRERPDTKNRYARMTKPTLTTFFQCGASPVPGDSFGGPMSACQLRATTIRARLRRVMCSTLRLRRIARFLILFILLCYRSPKETPILVFLAPSLRIFLLPSTLPVSL
jgi:hypothetical protein